MKRVFREPSTRARVWWSAAMLLPAAHGLGIMLDLDYLWPGVLAFLLWSALPRTGKTVTDRAVIYSFVAALALTAFGNYLGTFEKKMYPFSFYFLRLRVTGPLSLFGAALAARYRNRDHLLGLSALALFFAFGVSWDLSGAKEVPQSWPLLGGQGSFRAFYLLHAVPSLAAYAGALLWYDRPFRVRSCCRFAAALAAALLFFGGGMALHRRSCGALQHVAESLFSFSWHHQSQEEIFEAERRHSLLGGIVSRPHLPESREELEKVLFFVQSPAPPRCWRIAVFTEYRNGSWERVGGFFQPTEELQVELIDLSRPVKRADQQYRLTAAASGPLTAAELYFGNWRNPGQLPLPGNAAMLAITADRVRLDRDGGLSAEEMVLDAGCTVYCDRRAPEVPQRPDEPESDMLLVPRHLQNLLDDTLLLAGVTPLESDAVTAGRLIDYLQQHCRYASDWPGTPPFFDPVRLFLEERRSGHCELFASALALLLRRAGIPTRYVAGALCYEESGGSGRYVIRKRHLHAWVEAFDRDRKAWVMLDPTPGDDNDPAAAAETPAEELTLRWRYRWAVMLAGLRRGHWIGWLAGPVYAGYEAFRERPQPWLWGVGGLLAALLICRCWVARKRARRTRAYLARELDRCGRQLVRRGVLPKGKARILTAAEMLAAVKISPQLSPAEKLETEAFLSDYLKRRFG